MIFQRFMLLLHHRINNIQVEKKIPTKYGLDHMDGITNLLFNLLLEKAIHDLRV